MNYKKGFSLAEALTTLMIIGVIATITIPILSTNIHRSKTITMLKKMYSSYNVYIKTILNNADIISDNITISEIGSISCDTLSCLRIFDDADTSADESEKAKAQQTKNSILANKKYLNLLEGKHQFCSSAETSGCVPAIELPNGYEANNFSVYTLQNGSSIAVYAFPENCTTSSSPVVKAGTIIPLCGIVIFDINSHRGPNIPGQDLFAYYISDEDVNDSYLIPAGLEKNDNKDKNRDEISSKVYGNASGYNRTAAIMNNNWKWTELKEETDKKDSESTCSKSDNSEYTCRKNIQYDGLGRKLSEDIYDENGDKTGKVTITRDNKGNITSCKLDGTEIQITDKNNYATYCK